MLATIIGLFSCTAMNILGVDIGGTFTDFVSLHEGRLTIYKLLSTPDDPARALLQGIAVLGPPDALVHGTTVATNALLERRGAPTALITTAGFRDVLAIGRGNRPSLYDLDITRDPPVVEDAWRLEIAERLDHHGTIVQSLDADHLHQLIATLLGSSIESVAICLLHAYANPIHEQFIITTIEQIAPPNRFYLSASHRIMPEPREYERTSTTVVNAYVAPVLGRYLTRLESALREKGVASLRLMASDGGSMGLATAQALAARATLSGPAGGVVGARFVAQRAGFERIITFDMGGTSTDVALCDGTLPRIGESHVGGLPVHLPSIDIHTVGAGGGSIARIDAGGALRAGPQSAGANPGPACYGHGDLPTVTDANLLLGRLQANYFLDGQMKLDNERSEAAFALLTQHLAIGIDQAALGVVRVAHAAMDRAIRTISVERGYDPRDFVLVAFGGAGPLHAAYLATELGMRRVLVPRYPGVLSALGMLTADVTRDASQALLTPLDQLDLALTHKHMESLAKEGLQALATDGEPTKHCHIEFTLDLRYVGQSYEITTPLVDWEASTTQRSPLTAADLRQATTQFHTLHERRYGHAMPEHPVEVVLLRMRAISVRPPLSLHLADELPTRTKPLQPRTIVEAALSDQTAVRTPTSLYDRTDLYPGDGFAGPAIVVQLDTTTIIPPAWSAEIDADLNLLLTLAW
ncbi:MAG: hypothetical protein GFH27_549445n26 [Chloroflexi bacterium AL-W]|nr:hypothetical protein [Chloroflexi bacterium AL-N1]NOK71682.1 hypothetical protein [Chloroflexi bacterium AL-N10]NOK79023.1 hypothetical protein [Chloroflexi bacterium AL-N5]NOK86457.1 hypothetical protein [Chloroflexi bacterium AL-W]NOK93423.1 hypothetical protein [Chloroflexi bacterium AL-N15]